MFKEKIIQINGSRVLTNKGRLFERFSNLEGIFWAEIELPKFIEEKIDKIPIGKSKFIEPISQKEKFNKASNLGDLLDE